MDSTSPDISVITIVTGSTNIHPLMAILILVLCVMAFTIDRKYLIVLFFICLNFSTKAQRIAIASIDFPLMRILLMAVLARVLLKNEHGWLHLNKMDRILIGIAVVSAACTMLRQSFSMSGINLGISGLIDTLGYYFVARLVVRTTDDVVFAAKCLMVISFFIIVLFVFERLTGINPMGTFGGVSPFTWIREGKLRVQGPYAHPILSGAYWASIFPLFFILSSRREGNGLPIRLAMIFSVAIVFLCASSTPLMGLMAGIAACLLYFQRESLNFIKVGIVSALLALAAVWNHPIWYLFAKVDFTGGSTGDFRYLLTDAFVRNWKDWVFIGTNDTTPWGANLNLAGDALGDVCIQYLLQGVTGGLIGFCLFIAIIGTAFSYLGQLLYVSVTEKDKRLYWQVGVSLLVHMTNFLGVSYFGGIEFSWWMTLAMCASLYQTRQPECMAIIKKPYAIAVPAGSSA